MAEFVEKKLEEMIPEMEELDRTGLLSPEEVRALVIKRRHWAYKIGSMTPCKTDFVACLNFEAQLMEFIKIRRKKMQMFEKFQHIEVEMVRRQQKLLRHITRRYVDDLDLWDMRINFSTNTANLHEVTTSYKEMTLKHARRLTVWVNWANFEMTFRKNFDKARQILMVDAALNHQNNFIIKRETFRFVLLYAEFLFVGRITNDTTNEGSVPVLSAKSKGVMSCAAAKLVYQNTVSEHPEVEAATQLYYIASKFPFTQDLKEEIYADILERCFTTPEAVVLMAERRALQLPVVDGEQHVLGGQVAGLTKERGRDSDNEDADSDDQGEGSDDQEEDSVQEDSEGDVEEEANEIVEDDEEVKEVEDGAKVAEDLMGEDGDTEEEDDETNGIINCASKEGQKVKHKHITGAADDTEDDGQHMKVYKLFKDDYFKKKNQGAPLPVTGAARKKMMTQLLSTLEAALDESERDPYDVLLPLYLNQLLALLYHCWSCRPTRSLLATTFCSKCAQYKEHLTPEQLLIWASVAEHLSSSCGEWSSKQVLAEAARLHPSHNATLVYALKRIINRGNANNKAIIAEYNRIRKQLPVPWQRFAHNLVVSNLQRGKERSKFLKQQYTAVGLDEQIKHSNRLAWLWTQYQDKGLDAARAVYNELKTGSQCERLFASMCLIELYGERNSDIASPSTSSGTNTCADKHTGNPLNTEGDDNDEEENFKLTLKPDLDRVRDVFKWQHIFWKSKHHDSWLARYHFEDRFGDAAGLVKNAEFHMDGWNVQAFRDMMMDIRDQRFQEPSEEETASSGGQLKACEPLVPATPGLMHCLQQNYYPTLTEDDHDNRQQLYTTLAQVKQHISAEPVSPPLLGVSWYDVLIVLLDGRRVRPRVHPDQEKQSAKPRLDSMAIVQPLSDFLLPNKRLYGKKKKLFIGSDCLQVAPHEETDAAKRRVIPKADPDCRDNIEAMLERSTVLHPDFVKKKEIGEIVSKKRTKKLAKEERAKTTGKGWDFMKAPEMTHELKQHMDLLKMRGIIDPKRRYVKSHLKVTPKYFQIGKVVYDPLDYYSQRPTKKQSKSTFVEQIMSDQQSVQYQKRKYSQLVARREANRPKKKQKTGPEYIKV